MDVTPLHALLLIAAGAVTGLLGAILGTGGGVFLIPILVMLLGVPMHEAVATSIVSVIATSSAVASTNVERGIANMRLGMTLEIATALGAIAGGLTAGGSRPKIASFRPLSYSSIARQPPISYFRRSDHREEHSCVLIPDSVRSYTHRMSWASDDWRARHKGGHRGKPRPVRLRLHGDRLMAKMSCSPAFGETLPPRAL